MARRKIKETVRLREKKIRRGKSLYLDIYYEGNRSYEFLKLYVIDKPKNEVERNQNHETKRLAEAIKSERLLELQAGKYQKPRKKKNQAYVLPFWEKLIEDSSNSKRNIVRGAMGQLEKFRPGITFDQVNVYLVEDFKSFLKKEASVTQTGAKLKPNSQVTYFNQFKTMLFEAYRANILRDNIAEKVKPIPRPSTQREFLTLDEVQQLVRTECDLPELKKAFLFSCLTGLRYGDINKLRWMEVRESGSESLVVYQQQKTDKAEILPLSEQARELLGKRGLPDQRIFQLNYSRWMNLQLQRWINKAGITKKITFHHARHTYATLLISNGADLYAVSKLLGHSDVSTTQIYAKMLDEKKREAANKIPKLEM